MKTTKNSIQSNLTKTLAFAAIASVSVGIPSAVLGQNRDRDRGQSRDRDTRNERDQRDQRDRRDRKDREDRPVKRDNTHIEFTRSQEGKRFENGITLRKGTSIVDRRLDTFFPTHYHSYPHYVTSTRASVDVVVSPFHFYLGIFPEYITRRDVILSRPSHIYIDAPIYVRNVYRGYDDYYLSRRPEDTRWKEDAELRQSVYDLEDSFRHDDITLLTPLTDPGVKVGIFSRGRFEYSLEVNDYLDMTRDFMRTARTTTFEAYRVHYKSRGVYQVFVKHVYRSQEGDSRTVYLCFAMERIGGRWTITQVDTTPDRI